ncbi:MAG: carbohydrate kinase family protein [Actinophytocola sp.]|uniref:carbohydrate kinase family protein n=1 Tax=Actinophytocola sp. TaxID=1872138 RepID=UPI001322CED1|nr:carbohydrate kinase family protein [Actinophytocola sp.]MPZ86223.1 carbohydrate kinase family protein [Actinophytocola sp.]
MTIVVTGSIATDYLMVFPGRFADQLMEGKLDKVSLSFLADELEIRRGGVAANIAYGLGCLGHAPVLVGSVGADFAEYGTWLADHNVNTDHVRYSTTRHTAKFLCTTDTAHNQIATFYAGAMDEAREIELAPILAGLADPLVVVSPNDPDAMLRHTTDCRELGVPFVADPSQQLARMTGEDIRELVDGAAYLFTNEYERTLLTYKTGWADDDVLDRVGTWVTTRGRLGASIESCERATVIVPVVTPAGGTEPTGVGDAFRAGFLAGIARRFDQERSAQLGCMLATLVLETIGTQEYRIVPETFVERISSTYGPAAGAAAQSYLDNTLVKESA